MNTLWVIIWTNFNYIFKREKNKWFHFIAMFKFPPKKGDSISQNVNVMQKHIQAFLPVTNGRNGKNICRLPWNLGALVSWLFPNQLLILVWLCIAWIIFALHLWIQGLGSQVQWVAERLGSTGADLSLGAVWWLDNFWKVGYGYGGVCLLINY